ncbi:hypothetical protein [Streptomyces liangshanensis]|uniref:Uncharacterized protein n=1 Tax=Streptomyces liangshanensis TaxID=2717324 RepID=A0A6G9H2C0_9ACTN|nr:hypothetical protein [Streptomyces liangshanensis]QIQ04683.1 hypothetical protein HA039_22480 [Streptomyces liangshanensis]
MGNEGDGGVPVPQDRVAMLLGDLLIELGQKVQQAGVDGVRILTDEEVIRDQVRWYRTGWAEHARAADPAQPTAAGHPDMEDLPVPSGRLLRFPDQSADDASADVEPMPPAPGTPGAPDTAARPHSTAPTHPHPHPESRHEPEARCEPEVLPASQAQRLPIVGAGEANVRNLMPHRPRHRRATRERGDEG